MKSVHVTAPDTTAWVEVEKPTAGPNDILLKMKADGICGSDALYAHLGGIPPRQGATPLGHEPAAEVAEIGENVHDINVGDHVVINTMVLSDGLLGSGGAQGGLTEYVLIKDFEPGKQLRVIPKDIPWHVAALNEPMAVARHAVNRTGAKAGDKVAIFGAGPIGLGAVMSFKHAGVGSIVVIDIQENRLKTALEIGADAVIDSSKEDVAAKLVELHGDAATQLVSGARPGTDIYLDAAGAPSIPVAVTGMAKPSATFGVVAVHKKPVELDFGAVLPTELNIVFSMGYPNEIFEVTDDIIANWQKYEKIISHKIPFDQALDALKLAATPGAAEKVVVVFD